MKQLTYNRIYAYTTIDVEDKEWEGSREGKGLIKVGQTTQETVERIKQQLQGAPHLLKDGYKILIDEEAIDIHGNYFKDIDVFKWLRLLGVYRIPGTEWFEATLEEIKKALEYTISCRSGRTKPYKNKNTAEKRGISYNKEEAQRERNKLKDSYNTINIMSLYPDSTSILKLTKNFINYYKIKQYSVSSASIYVGGVVKTLIENGIVENKGTKQFPKLILTSNTNVLNVSEIKKPKISLEELKSLISNSKKGISVPEIKNKYEVPYDSTASLYLFLENNFIKIKEGNSPTLYVSPKNYKEPGKISRCFQDTLEFENYTEKDVFNVKNALKGVRIKKLQAQCISEKANVSLNQLEQIIKNAFPKLTIVTQKDIKYIEYKSCCYISNKEEREKIKVERINKDINKLKELLENFNEGLTIKEISKRLEWSKSYTYRICNKIRKEKDFQKINDKVLLSKHELDPFIKLFPVRAMRTALKHGITKEEILSVIKSNPYCTSKDISLALLKSHNLSYSESYFDEVVAVAKRELLKEQLIVCTTKVGNLHIKDEEHQVDALSTKYEIDINKLFSFIKTFKTGATTKDIYNFIGGKMSATSLIFALKKFPELKGFRVCSEKMKCNLKYYYKWFLKEQEICLNKDEELFEAITWVG